MSSMKVEGSFRSYESVRASKLEELTPGAKKLDTKRGGAASDSNYKANVQDIDKLGKSMADALNSNDMEAYGELKLKMEEMQAQSFSSDSPDRAALMERTTMYLERFDDGFRKTKKPPADGLTLLDFLNIKDGLGSKKDILKEGLKDKLKPDGEVTFLSSDFDPNNFEAQGGANDPAALARRKNKLNDKLERQQQVREHDSLRRIDAAKTANPTSKVLDVKA